MFVMYFMTFAKGNQIFVFGILEQLQSLVNDDVVHDKITQSVGKNSQTDEEAVIKTGLCPKIKQQNTGNGKNHEKQIIALENMGVFRLVVIGVQIPQKTVHHVFVRQPSHAFHQQISGQKNQERHHLIKFKDELKSVFIPNSICKIRKNWQTKALWHNWKP